MARSHGQIYSSIWNDADFVALSQGAQRLYMLLLSQQKLTLVGTLDYLPSRWARLAADTSLASVEAAIDELEASRFVVVDPHTDELLIRTLVKHDITTVLSNRNLLRGLWNAWDAIASRHLRVEVVRHIPDAVWESPRCQPHPDALEIRRSLQSEPPVPSDSSNDRSSPPSTFHHPPSTPQPGGDHVAAARNSRSDPPGGPAAVDNSPACTPDERQQRLAEAAELLVARELDRNPTRNGNPKRHADAVRRGKLRDHHQAGHQHLMDDPSLTAEALANLLEPLVRPERPASARERRDPYDDPGWQEAARARQEAGMNAAAQLRETPVDPLANKRGVHDARAALRRRPGAT